MNFKHLKTKSKNKMKLLFLDTETNGLPINKYAPYTSTEMWPHIVQISWQIIDSNTWNSLKESNYFIKPRALWNKEAERIHQIPESIATNFGKTPSYVFTELQEDIVNSNVIICHNLLFDKTVIMAEIQRLYEHNEFSISPVSFWNKNKEICSMVLTKNLCGLKFKDSKTNEFKFPSLNELYTKLFNTEYDVSGARLHNAKYDVSCLIMCFKEILKLPQFSLLLSD
jgi:DNA polymerase III epsilon subunit-like protein